MSIRHELSALRDEICNMKCLHETISSDKVTGEKQESRPYSGLEGDITMRNATWQSAGSPEATPRLKDLKEEIQFIKDQNIQLSMRINSITLIPGTDLIHSYKSEHAQIQIQI